MARYRKVDVRVHADKRVQRLSRPQPNGYSLWMYLLTCPFSTSIPGLFKAGESALAEDIGWELEGFRKAFREVLREGLAEYDPKARIVWLPKAPRYNSPESPNVVKGWRIPWDELPESALKAKAYQSLRAFTEGLGKAFAEAFRQACPQPSLNQEQEQEQDQEQEQEQDPSEDRSPVEGTSACAELDPASSTPPVLEFPTVGPDGHTWGVSQPAVDAWARDFPTVDVLAELRKAHAWIVANPGKRKTARGMPAFCVRWLTKATDSPRRSPPANGGLSQTNPKTAGNRDAFARVLARHRAREEQP